MRRTDLQYFLVLIEYQQSREMLCDERTHEMAWYPEHLRGVPTTNASFQSRKAMGRPPYPCHRARKCCFSSGLCNIRLSCIGQNIRVIAEYYSRIKLERLRSLLDLSLKQTEEILSRLVVSGTVWARIDRPAGIVNFRSKRTAEEVMNDWSSDMQKLLGLVEKTWMGMNAAQAAQARVKAAAAATSTS